jgi:WhiB family redox-sensing transcriptional regulator
MPPDSDEAWKQNSACRGLDPALWFPVDNTTTSRENTTRALAICSECTVREECLEFGWKELFGTWGGMTQRERLLARREEFRRDKAWNIAFALVVGQADVPEPGYDSDSESSRTREEDLPTDLPPSTRRRAI